MTTEPAVWELDTRPLPDFPLRAGRVVVISAHPDDETLAVGGLLAALAGAGCPVDLVVATDGEAAFPEFDARARAGLARRRRREMEAALGALGLDHVSPLWLGLPDSALDRRQLAARLRPVLDGADLCLAPWPNDPHPDHRAAGLAARDAAGEATVVWGYPVWTWVWQNPGQAALPWDAAARHRLDPGALAAKQSAIDRFESQVQPGPAGRPPVVGPAARAHFAQPVEVLFRLPGPVSTPIERFESLYRDRADPWGTATRDYERRKRSVSLASLPRSGYRRGLDAGSGSGLLTAELARRCGELIAIDGAAAAVAATRASTAGLPNVTVRRAVLPGGVPAGPFDLMVFSEVLYYLNRVDLDATLEAAERAAGPGADLLAVDWRPVTPDAPRDADSAHAQLTARPGWEVLVEHAEAEFLLHVLRRR